MTDDLKLIKFEITYDEKSSKNPGTYTFLYLETNEETARNVATLKQAIENCGINSSDRFDRILKQFEKKLGLQLHDGIDDNNKIIPAAHYAYSDGTHTFSHYKNGKLYNFLDMACMYYTNKNNEITDTIETDDGAIIKYVDQLTKVQFATKYAFYIDKVKAAARVKEQVEQIAISAEKQQIAQKLTLDC